MPCAFGDKHKGKLTRVWLDTFKQTADVCPRCEAKIVRQTTQEAAAVAEEFCRPIEAGEITGPLFGGPMEICPGRRT